MFWDPCDECRALAFRAMHTDNRNDRQTCTRLTLLCEILLIVRERSEIEMGRLSSDKAHVIIYRMEADQLAAINIAETRQRSHMRMDD